MKLLRLTVLLLAALPVPAEVSVTTARYEGAEHFVVRTATATYWYDRAGGGLSRLIDPNGRDWIGFRREPWNVFPASAASSYRGIPNFVFGSAEAGAGHPGFTNCTSTAEGNRIISTSRSGLWRWTWTFHDDHAQVAMEKVGPGGYWFLYEGTPGGSRSPRDWVWGNDRDGPSAPVPDFIRGERALGYFRWAWFGSRESPKVLFVAQVNADDLTDSFGVMGNTREGLASPEGMVVFGFGRAKDAKPLLTEPNRFVLGFADSESGVREAVGRLSDRQDRPGDAGAGSAPQLNERFR